MDEPLITLLQNLQDTPIPTIFAAVGCILLVTSAVGTLWKHNVPPKRRKNIGCFGTIFLFLSILLYEGILLLHNYAPTVTTGEVFLALAQFFTLFVQGLQQTPLPPILASAGSIIVVIGIVGIFGGREISRQQQIGSICFGVFFLITSIFLYETSFFIPRGSDLSNSNVESLKVFFEGGTKSVTTKNSYEEIVVITAEGEEII